MASGKVIVIGAGMAGLVAALDMAVRGLDVTVVERAGAPGGKMREIAIGDRLLDAGPTVFTLRRVFEEIFADAGSALDEFVVTRPAEVLARHAWSAEERLDLYAELTRSIDAIAEFAGSAEARRFREFADQAKRVHDALEHTFMHAARPTPFSLMRRAGLAGLPGMLGIQPFTSLWKALGKHFQDPRLRQLFGRYATYCGSSPFLAPATLMLVAHVEREGVWLIEGGMHRLATALAALAASHGATFRYDSHVHEILLRNGRAAAIRLAKGEQLEADAIVVNADVAAIADGLLGPQITRAVKPVARSARSLSAVTWNLVAKTEGFPLLRHNVFFSAEYAAEFDDIFRRTRLPRAPTVYVCAQDRDDEFDAAHAAPERLLCLVNAPPAGDSSPLAPEDIERCADAAFGLLSRCGLRIERTAGSTITTTPSTFERLFPGTGGSLYGSATHGWRASFSRPGSRSRIPGLYLAGGSVHPGPGVPMTALSGRLAAACVIDDFGRHR